MINSDHPLSIAVSRYETECFNATRNDFDALGIAGISISIELVVSPVSEVTSRGRANHFTKHRDEGARAVIAQVHRDVGDKFSSGQALERKPDVHLLAPLEERHPGLALEKAT